MAFTEVVTRMATILIRAQRARSTASPFALAA
jgi:hypothetical protein